MKIAVIGAGAMGSLFGGYLSQTKNEVILIDIWEEHVEKINNKGLKILKNDEKKEVQPKAMINSEEIPYVDLMIIFVKSIYTEEAVKQNLSIINEDTIVLSLQNGIGNIEKINKYVDEKNIVAGTTSNGATLLEPGKIRYAGEGKTHIGSIIDEKQKSVEKVQKLLEKAGFKTKISDNVLKLIWDKLLINVGINALTAILDIKNGELLENKETKDLLKEVVKEGIEVAEKKGIEFDRDKTIEKVLNIADMTGENRSSMLQDVSNKRKTEINTINGAIVKEAEKFSVKVPVNKTLTKLIQAIEKNY